jgi:hypothetical protein
MEKVAGSVLSPDQVIVTEPPDVGLEDITKFDNAEAKGRKKRTRLKAGYIRLCENYATGS